ncbi:DUF7262 family protein [Halopenitus persicus]|uniref:Uncharacterized protein n=1 Tax=Halopenitus persicus TaxID=1048396 RepID=A0A1H3IFM2_9EURY|nr:hypothetical protein [Halopenitus persicus]SDY26407.1 hypothetical protein SAMN05216564_104105 [Halopenitus persicus]
MDSDGLDGTDRFGGAVDPFDCETSPPRGQLSLSAVEAAIGVAFVLAIATTFAVAPPDPGTETAQLDAYATDVATVLGNEGGTAVGDGNATGAPLPAAIATPATFAAEREAIDARADALVPDRLQYHVKTPHGGVGIAPPSGATVGRSTLYTRNGRVVVAVWR